MMFARVILSALFLAALVSAKAPSAQPDKWPAFQREILGIVAGEATCGPMSLQFGFCRRDTREAPTQAEAALSDACRGQPLAYLAGLGRTPVDMADRRATAAALRRLFETEPFGAGNLSAMNVRTRLHSLHDRDQALRFFNSASVGAANAEIAENGKWVAICAHALFARDAARHFLATTTPAALARDEELANWAWLLVQHSDFDPGYQLAMSAWFARSDARFMREHAGYLHDRAMVGLHRLQRYGTQIRCADGAWGPFPVEDPGGLDARRATLGLRPMAEHLAGRRPCPPPRQGS